MARTSKRYKKVKDVEIKKIHYNAGIYTRLSSERKEEWREKSNSIELQELACKEYALKENINIVEVYTDYEYSGTNFERPKFQEMMQDIRDRKINCIIIRDLSRLGREYLEMGRLIDKVFPFLGVRFISVNDNVDTFKEVDNKKSFEITLKNIINDLYAKDISKKIISSKHNRARKGYFIGSNPPYGYKIEKTKEGQKLIVDEKVRFIVEEMFNSVVEGKSLLEITRTFNKKGYTPGMVYYKTGRVYRKEGDKEWHKGTITKMLANISYAGCLMQCRKQQNLSKNQKQKVVPIEDRIFVENTHEAIIPREVFDKVQEIKLKNKREHVFSSPMKDFKREPENRFTDLVYNHNNGKVLVRRTRIYGKNRDRLYYSFQNNSDTGSLKKEKSVFIMERDLDKAIIDKVSENLKMITKRKDFINRIEVKYDKAIEKLNSKKIKLLDKITKEEIKIKTAYEGYSLGRMNLDKYKLKREVLLSKIEIITDEANSIDKQIINIKRSKDKAINWLNSLFKSKGSMKLSKDLIHALVERIWVYETHNFEVIFKFDLDNLTGGAKCIK